ncbi:MAG: PadR family transcriptional regulator [Anaerolineales bacterium]|jgi:DNA-binding PadR family transcriptional regulator
MSLPHIILGMLYQQPRSGYALKKELETTIHYFWDADISRIYRSLRDMEHKSWVEHKTVIQDDNPNKKVYSLTELGEEELKTWLAEPGKAPGVRNPFLAQLHFSEAIPVDSQLHVLKQHLENLKADLEELQSRARAFNLQIPIPSNGIQRGLTRGVLSLEYGIRRYWFEIEWTESAINKLEAALKEA